MTELNLICQQIQDQIDQMSQRQLRLVADQGPVSDHVRGCPVCRAHLAKARGLASQLDQWEVPQPGRNIVAAVMAELAALETDQRPARITLGEHLMSLLRVRIQVPAAAAILVLGGLVCSIGFNVIGARGPGIRPDPVVVRADVPVDPVTRFVPVQVQGAQSLQSVLANPVLVPGTVMVILGTPPRMPEESTSGRIPTTQNPL
ncbi:MAG: hypothetical protein KBE04_05335 [Phycisphaerae bacterium]|nr:hypothetical protein [Phycisphaerae bacterium]